MYKIIEINIPNIMFDNFDTAAAPLNTDLKETSHLRSRRVNIIRSETCKKQSKGIFKSFLQSIRIEFFFDKLFTRKQFGNIILLI